MQSERIQSTSNYIGGYSKKNVLKKRRKRSLFQPVDAVTFDFVEISNEEMKKKESNDWLISMIKNMPDKEVAERMKKHRNSFETIDDALTDKVIMEAI